MADYYLEFTYSFSVLKDVIRAVKNEYGDSPFMRELVSDFLIVNPMIQLLNKHSETGKNTFFFVSKNFDPLHKAKVKIIMFSLWMTNILRI